MKHEPMLFSWLTGKWNMIPLRKDPYPLRLTDDEIAKRYWLDMALPVDKKPRKGRTP